MDSMKTVKYRHDYVWHFEHLNGGQGVVLVDTDKVAASVTSRYALAASIKYGKRFGHSPALVRGLRHRP